MARGEGFTPVAEAVEEHDIEACRPEKERSGLVGERVPMPNGAADSPGSGCVSTDMSRRRSEPHSRIPRFRPPRSPSERFRIGLRSIAKAATALHRTPMTRSVALEPSCRAGSVRRRRPSAAQPQSPPPARSRCARLPAPARSSLSVRASASLRCHRTPSGTIESSPEGP